MPQPPPEAIARLSKRQWQALYWAGAPMSSPEIARRMDGIRPDTVDQHIKSACAKLGLSDRREAARWIRSSLGSVAIPEDWVSQTLGMVTAAATVLDDARRRAEMEPPRDHPSPQLDARGGRDDAPAPGSGVGPDNGQTPRPGPEGGALEPLPPGDVIRAPEPDGGRPYVGVGAATPPSADAGGGSPYDLIPPALRTPAMAAAGLLFVLMLIGGLYLLEYSIQHVQHGPRT